MYHFLDDELVEIYGKYSPLSRENFSECFVALMKPCLTRFTGSPNIVTLKQINNSFQLFIKRTGAPIRQDAFQWYFWKISAEPDITRRLFQSLRWPIPDE